MVILTQKYFVCLCFRSTSIFWPKQHALFSPSVYYNSFHRNQFNKSKAISVLFSVPKEDYNWTITLGGQLHVTWLRKFSQYQEDNPVDISWVGDKVQGSSNGTARLVTIPGLILGQRYTATMMDLRDEDTLATFSFDACKLAIREVFKKKMKTKDPDILLHRGQFHFYGNHSMLVWQSISP